MAEFLFFAFVGLSFLAILGVVGGAGFAAGFGYAMVKVGQALKDGRLSNPKDTRGDS